MQPSQRLSKSPTSLHTVEPLEPLREPKYEAQSMVKTAGLGIGDDARGQKDVCMLSINFTQPHAARRARQQLRCCRSNSGGYFTFSRFLRPALSRVAPLSPQCLAAIAGLPDLLRPHSAEKKNTNRGKTKGRQKNKYILGRARPSLLSLLFLSWAPPPPGAPSKPCIQPSYPAKG